MTRVSFNKQPFERNFHNFVDDLFTELPVFIKNDLGMTHRSVPVNITETNQAYQLEVIAPGFEKTDFKVNIDQNILTVTAERKVEEKDEKEKQVRREYRYQGFKRSFTLDEKVDATNIGASYINGVLVLNLPKKEPVKEAAKEIVIS